jgi:hypothetical protein
VMKKWQEAGFEPLAGMGDDELRGLAEVAD